MKIWVLAALCVSAAAASAATEPAELLPIARPDLTEMEPQVQAQFEQSLQILDEILASDAISDAELAEVYGNTGQLFMLYEFIPNARDCLLNAVQLSADRFRWLYYLGVVQAGDGDLEQAMVTFQRAQKIEPEDLPTRIRLGRVELALAKPEDAALTFRQVLDLDPNNPAAHYGLGRIAMLQEDYAAAVTHFAEVLNRQPQAATAHYQVGLAYRELGEIEKARHHLSLQGRAEVDFDDPLMQELGELVRGSSLFVVGATRAKAAGSFDEAVQLFRAALEVDPDNSAARQALASTLIQMGELDAAVQELEQSLEREPDNLATHYNLGTVLAQQGQTEPAIAHLTRAVEIDPEFEDGHVNLAVLMAQQGDLEASERHYAWALAIDPGDVESRQQRAQLLLRLGRQDEAIQQLQGVAQHRPSSAADHLELARALGNRGRFSEAADSFAQVLELGLDNDEVKFALALTLILAEKYADAAAHLNRSTQLAPGNQELRHLLARFLATCPEGSLRDGERALRIAQNVMRSQPSLDYAQTVAMAFAEVGQFEEAVALQNQIIEWAGPSVAPEQAARLARHLDLYEQRQPLRAPWLTNP